MIVLGKKDTLAGLAEGAKIMSEAVGATFGPMGRNVIIRDLNNNIVVTKDGVTVANAVHSNDPLAQIAIEMIRASSNKSLQNTGDGTSTTTLLACEFILQNYQYFSENNIDINLFKENNSVCIENLKSILSKHKKKVSTKNKKTLYNIALTASNGSKPIAKVVSEAVNKSGLNGKIFLELTVKEGFFVEEINGYSFNRGYEAPQFITNEKSSSVELLNCSILIINRKLERFDEIAELAIICKKRNSPLVIIAEEFTKEFIHNCLKNKSDDFMLLPVKLPEFGAHRMHYLDDLSLYTGAKICDKVLNYSDLGSCTSLLMDRDRTSIMKLEDDLLEEKICKRIELLETQIKQSDNQVSIDKLKDRISQLNSRNVIIKFGANNNLEGSEVKDLLDDAVGACQSAILSGILPGGGVALDRAGNLLPNTSINAEMIKKILQKPISLIDIYYKEGNVNFSRGFNGKTRKECDMVKEGIIDSYDTVINCIENAISVGTSILCSDSLIIQE